jgi:hypothetical protein
LVERTERDFVAPLLSPGVEYRDRGAFSSEACLLPAGPYMDNDKIRVSLVGGLTANLRLDMKAKVIQFFSLLDNANQRAD